MQKNKVLIVDDEMDMRIFLATLFETSGYAPTAVKNGTEGLKKAREMVPDLIILDVMMPGEGGVNMYQALKADAALKDIPVIMLTGVGRKSFNHFIKMLNFKSEKPVPEPEAYVEKPPEPDRLLEIAIDIMGGG